MLAVPRLGAFRPAEVLLDQLQAVLRQQQIGMSEQVADVEVASEDDLDARQVLERAADDEVRRGQHDQRGVVETDRIHEANGHAGARILDGEPVDDSHHALGRLLAERGTEGEAAHLLGHALRVAARVLSEDDRAALHRRLADRSVARAAGALLPVGLGASPGDGGARLGRRGALARVVGLAHERLVHDGRVHLLGEDHLRQPDLALALSRGIEQRDVEGVGRLRLGGSALGRLRLGLGIGRGDFVCLGLHVAHLGGVGVFGHQTFLPVGLPEGPLTFTGLVEVRTRTRAPFAPGTPPLTRMRFRSGSTRTTLYARAVVRTLPIWPDIFKPLNTRAESVDPMAPGWRTFMEPCDSGPRLNLCLLMRPWKPLPFEVAVTSTSSPAAKISALSSWPASRPSYPRISTMWRCGSTFAFLNSP